MKSNKGIVLTVLLLGLGGLALTIIQTGPTTVSAAPPPTPTTPVYVTNSGAAQAVPTVAQGTTAISGDVSISGTPTVTLASGAQVQVANPASSPLPVRDVDRPTAQPFNYSAVLVWNSGFAFANVNSGGYQQSFTVPEGKRLVIQFVSLQATVPPGDNVLFARLDTNPGMVLTVTHAGTDYQNNESFTATQRVFTILEPGTVVNPTAFCKGVCTSTSPSLGLIITVSGYYVDAV